jgi:hypothetical protein
MVMHRPVKAKDVGSNPTLSVLRRFMDDDKPTILSQADIDKFVTDMMNGKYDIKKRPCLKCSKDFFPNYCDIECDECWFSRFPKEQVEAFCRSFFE